MSKSLLFRLFRLGKIPKQLLATLERESILLLEEGVRGSLTYRNFRAPGRYSNWKRQWFPASVILTKTRLVALAYSNSVIDVPLTDERVRRLRCGLENDETVCIAFDASVFRADASGTLEYRFRTPQAHQYLEQMRERAF